jgi:Histone methylation protein DOT1
MLPAFANYTHLVEKLHQATRKNLGIWNPKRQPKKRRFEEIAGEDGDTSTNNKTTRKRTVYINFLDYQQHQTQQQGQLLQADRVLSTGDTIVKAAIATEEVPHQCFPVGTPVKKHFPGEGWYCGAVQGAEWGGEVGQSQWVYRLSFNGDRQNDLVNEVELADLVVDPTLYTHKEFQDLWAQLDPEEIEKSPAVRRANSRMLKQDSEMQWSAQYGRLLPVATDVSAAVFPLLHRDTFTHFMCIAVQRLFQVLRLKRSDIFLDIGHGIGNCCLQATYCNGCESRGIEVVPDRYNISLKVATSFQQGASRLDADQGRVSSTQNWLDKHFVPVSWSAQPFVICALSVHQQYTTNIVSNTRSSYAKTW